MRTGNAMLAVLLLAACSGDDGTSAGCPTSAVTTEQQKQCRAAPNCQLLVRTCMTPAMCPDGPGPPACLTTTQPTASSGPACDTLDEAACRMRDDCLQIKRVEDNVVTCHAE